MQLSQLLGVRADSADKVSTLGLNSPHFCKRLLVSDGEYRQENGDLAQGELAR